MYNKETDEIKAKLLNDLIIAAPSYKTFENFVEALQNIRDSIVLRIESNTCKQNINNVLLEMNTFSACKDIHTYNKAKMYLGLELKANKEESYLAYLLLAAMKNNDFTKLRDHMKCWW